MQTGLEKKGDVAKINNCRESGAILHLSIMSIFLFSAWSLSHKGRLSGGRGSRGDRLILNRLPNALSAGRFGCAASCWSSALSGLYSDRARTLQARRVGCASCAGPGKTQSLALRGRKNRLRLRRSTVGYPREIRVWRNLRLTRRLKVELQQRPRALDVAWFDNENGMNAKTVQAQPFTAPASPSPSVTDSLARGRDASLPNQRYNDQERGHHHEAISLRESSHASQRRQRLGKVQRRD